MYNFHTDVVTALKTAYTDVYYEEFLDEQCAKQCISYREDLNAERLPGNTIGYSDVTYTVKVWGYSLSWVLEIACSVDDKMSALGFHRESSAELINGDYICKVLRYTGLCQETYTTQR